MVSPSYVRFINQVITIEKLEGYYEYRSVLWYHYKAQFMKIKHYR